MALLNLGFYWLTAGSINRCCRPPPVYRPWANWLLMNILWTWIYFVMMWSKSKVCNQCYFVMIFIQFIVWYRSKDFICILSSSFYTASAQRSKIIKPLDWSIHEVQRRFEDAIWNKYSIWTGVNCKVLCLYTYLWGTRFPHCESLNRTKLYPWIFLASKSIIFVIWPETTVSSFKEEEQPKKVLQYSTSESSRLYL